MPVTNNLSEIDISVTPWSSSSNSLSSVSEEVSDRPAIGAESCLNKILLIRRSQLNQNFSL